MPYFYPFFLFQGFEDCLVFDELMDKFNNDLSKCTFSGGRRLAQMISCRPVYDTDALIVALPQPLPIPASEPPESKA